MPEIQTTLPLFTWRSALESWASSDEPGLLQFAGVALQMEPADARGARLLLELMAANPDLTADDVEQTLLAAISWNRLMVKSVAADRTTGVSEGAAPL